MSLKHFWSSITKNHAVILIGEDHIGAWVNTAMSKKALNDVITYHEQHNKPIICWYEGESKGGSDSFRNFMRWVQSEYRGIKFIEKSWEPSFRSVATTKEERILLPLFGPAQENFEPLFNNGIFIDELVQKKSWRGDKSDSITKDDILSLVNKSFYKDEMIEILQSKISKKNMKQWFVLREEVFEDEQSKLFKMQHKINMRRQDFLLKHMKNDGGIFLIGESHIPELKSRGKLS